MSPADKRVLIHIGCITIMVLIISFCNNKMEIVQNDRGGDAIMQMLYFFFWAFCSLVSMVLLIITLVKPVTIIIKTIHHDGSALFSMLLEY